MAEGAFAFRPEIFEAATGAGRLAALASSGTAVVDTLASQLEELAQTRAPSRSLARPECDVAIEAIAPAATREHFGMWVHYPWKRTVVRLLPESMFVEVRSDRNRHKILAREQALLRQKRIGIVGLSVGHAVATTMALEGIGGRFRLADMDALGLSNLNRLKASVLELGINKAVVAARAMFEIDPYIEIEIFPEGVVDANMPALLGEGEQRLDLLVEECDDFYAKVRLRELARARKIPVVMETSDGCMLDIERFDREPQRAVLHGLLEGVTADDLRGLSAADKVPFALRVLDVPRMSTRTRASLLEVRQTLSTWPQLASAVALGGGVTADAARRILLDEMFASGRFKVDVERLIADETATTPRVPSAPPSDSWAPSLPRAPRERGPARAGREETRFLVEHAVLAPSGGNAQPWRFEARAGEIAVFLDRTRSTTILDAGHFGSFCAIGACLENMTLAAARLGYHAQVDVAYDGSEGERVARVLLAEGHAPASSPLYEAIAMRATSRHTGARVPLPEASVHALVGAADGLATVISDEARLAALAECAASCDRARLLSASMHRELVGELRFTAEEALATRDGIDWRALELPKRDAAAIEIFRDERALAFVATLGGGAGLGEGSAVAMRGASLALVIQSSAREGSPAAYVELGRRMQRVWLTATSLGVAVQPVAVPFVARLAQMASMKERLVAADHARIEALERAYRRIVPDEGRAEMLLRIHLGGAPTVRARRRPIEDVYRYEGD